MRFSRTFFFTNNDFNVFRLNECSSCCFQSNRRRHRCHTQNLNNLYKYTRLWCALKIINCAYIHCAHRRNICGHEDTYKGICGEVYGKWITFAWHACMSNKNYLYNIFFNFFYFSFIYITQIYFTYIQTVQCPFFYVRIACMPSENTFSCKTTTNNHKIVISSTFIFFIQTLTLLLFLVWFLLFFLYFALLKSLVNIHIRNCIWLHMHTQVNL